MKIFGLTLILIGLAMFVMGPEIAKRERQRLDAKRSGPRVGAPNRSTFYATGAIFIIGGVVIAFQRD